jgi:hypothetical protein
MAKNDKLLLDQIIAELAESQRNSIGEAFQSLAIGELLKDLDLAADDLELGMVDGRDDGGIDAWYTFLDGELITDVDDIPTKRNTGHITVYVFTAKHHDTFRQEPVVHLYASILDLLDLSKSEEELASRYNDDLLSCRSVFKNCLIKTARSNPKLHIRFAYVSRGDSEAVAENIKARAAALVAECNSLFSDCQVTFEFAGAKEILAATRKIKDFSAVLTFEEGPISRGGTNYVGLAKLGDYYKLVTDSAGELRRYLFESNVRDYVGRSVVNTSIMATLRDRSTSESEDFWWLNNGVTIIATKAKVIGKDLHLDNVQIVNGLQTTESLYKCFSESGITIDNRCLLVKVLVTNEKALADKIILATNNQNKVDIASLHATDKIQRDIEDILAADAWYYDRRKNYYLNQGKPRSRIVSMTFMSWAVMAVRLGEPYQCNRARPKYMQSASTYRRIFSEKHDLNMYRSALGFCKSIETKMLDLALHVQPYEASSFVNVFRFLYAHAYASVRFGRLHRTDAEVGILSAEGVDEATLLHVHGCVVSARIAMKEAGQSLRRLHRSTVFQSNVEALCAARA